MKISNIPSIIARSAVALTIAGVSLSPAVALASSTPTVSTASVVSPSFGAFIAPPVFGPQGSALAVYSGGNIDQLEVAANLAGARGVWVQDTTGRYALLPVSGPTFLKAGFATAFPAAGVAAGMANSTNGDSGMNFADLIAVTLIR